MSVKGTGWPTKEEQLLLQAALYDGQSAVDSWRSWRRVMSGTPLDAGSSRLLPLVYRNLHPLGIQDSDMRRARVLYFAATRKNEAIFSQLRVVLRELRQLKIPAMILKGAALSALYYRDSGVRPMDDVDLFVPAQRVLEAAEVLYKLGWRDKDQSVRDQIGYRHAAALVCSGGGELDLHWHLLWDGCDEEADGPFWDAAQPIQFQGIPTLSLHPSDQLLHVCVHGMAWNSLSPIRWIPDSMMVLRQSGQSLDWERLLQRAEALSLVLPLREALIYLSKVLEAPIPRTVLRDMQRLPVSVRQKWEFRSRVQDRRRSIFGGLPQHLFHFWRTHRSRSIVEKATQLPAYLRFAWRLENNLAVFLALFRKVARRTWLGVRRPLGEDRHSGRDSTQNDSLLPEKHG